MQAALGKEFVPKNTATSTKWAVLNFVAWRNGRNAQDQIHALGLLKQFLAETVTFVQETHYRVTDFYCFIFCSKYINMVGLRL